MSHRLGTTFGRRRYGCFLLPVWTCGRAPRRHRPAKRGIWQQTVCFSWTLSGRRHTDTTLRGHQQESLPFVAESGGRKYPTHFSILFFSSRSANPIADITPAGRETPSRPRWRLHR